MKKYKEAYLLFAFVLCFMFGALGFPAVDDKFADIVETRDQAGKVVRARALLQNARETVRNTHAELTVISQSGSFNTIDTELKQTLLAAWQVVQDANDGFSDPNIAKLLDWSP